MAPLDSVRTREKFRRSHRQRPIDIALRHRQFSVLVADGCLVIVFRRWLQLHLCSVREIPVAGVNEVSGAAHEAQLHTEQICAIVQIGMVHNLILRFLFRLQLVLAEGVVACQYERHNGADSDRYSQQAFH